MGETWSLAVDMQLFLITPFIVYAIWRWRRAGLAILAALTLATLAINVYVFASHNLHMTQFAHLMVFRNL